jgi:hypothetical protein
VFGRFAAALETVLSDEDDVQALADYITNLWRGARRFVNFEANITNNLAWQLEPFDRVFVADDRYGLDVSPTPIVLVDLQSTFLGNVVKFRGWTGDVVEA